MLRKSLPDFSLRSSGLFPATLPPPPPPSRRTHDVCSIKASPGKGLGVFAENDILEGTQVIQEEAAIVFKNSSTTLARELEMMILSLPPKLSEHFWSLAEKPEQNGMTRAWRVWSANSFELGGMEDCAAIFLDATRINHSCVPNADWETTGKTITIFANRFVQAGEEIFINYSSRTFDPLTSKRRSNVLRGAYGFTCTCRSCTLPEEQQIASDKRRQQIAALYWRTQGLQTPDLKLWDQDRPDFIARERALDVGPLYPCLPKSVITKDWEALAKLYGAEDLGGDFVAQAYFHAHSTQFQLLNDLGNNIDVHLVERAMANAELAFSALLRCRPKDNAIVSAMCKSLNLAKRDSRVGLVKFFVSVFTFHQQIPTSIDSLC